MAKKEGREKEKKEKKKNRRRRRLGLIFFKIRSLKIACIS